MKRILSTFAVLLVCLTAFAQNYSPKFLDGHLYLKFKDNYPINYVVNADKTVDVSYFKDYQHLFEQYGVSLITRPLDAFQDPKLLRTIELTFSHIDEIEAFIKELQAFPEIEYAEKIPLMFPYFVPNDPYYGTVGGYNYKWHLDMVNAAAAWDLQQGETSVKVAIVDNAIWGAHPDLQISSANLCTFTANNSYTTGSASPPSDVAQNAGCTQEDIFTNGTCDAYSWSHGTHCAGLAGAINNNNTGVASLGGGVTLMGVRTSETMEYLSFTDAGVNWAANNGARVISMSFGGSDYSTTSANLYQTLYNNNIICVAAAGNEGDAGNALSYPACYIGVISVASLDSDGSLSYFSQYGEGRADIAAPGGYTIVNGNNSLPNMLSTTYCTSQLYRVYGVTTFDNTNYDGMQGTSMACPMVAGLCGLLVSAYADITPDQVLECLQSTATPLASGSNQIDGNGYINAEAAVACALSYASAIQVEPGELDFNTTVGTTSASQSVVVTTSGLSNNIAVTTAAPFQVSTNNITWSTTTTLTANGGTLYVHYQPTAVGTHNGTLTLTSAGETPVVVTLTGTATAQGDCDAPTNFTVVATNDVTADLSWSSPFTASIVEDVESHTAFTINSPGSIGWSYIDGDGANTYTYSSLAFTNEGSPMAYIVMDATQVTGSISMTAHSGNKFFGVPIADGTTNNDWIISPELNFANNFTFSFYGRSAHTSYSSEQFYVAYSTTGMAQSDFTNLSNLTTSTTNWTQYSYTVPAAAKYVAIHCVSNDQFFFCVDDITIEGDANITYRVYRDGQLITTTTNTQYTDNNLMGGNYNYCVEAVYDNNCVSSQVCQSIFMVGSEPFLTVDDNQVDLNAAQGSSDTIHLTTNTDWTITTDCGDMFTITPMSGHGSANIIIVANNDNTSLDDSISCTITINGEGVGSETIVVVQNPIIPFINATPNVVLLAQPAVSTNSFDIQANVEWDLQCNESWVLLSENHAVGNATITVTALNSNPGSTPRTATITATSAYTNTVITVQQAGIDPFLNTSTDEIVMGTPAGRTATFAVLSNVNWTISNNASWLTVTPQTGSDNRTIMLTTNSENTIGTSRYAMLTITDGTIIRTVEVEQEYNVGITETENSDNFSIYPNPATTTICIHSTQPSAQYEIVNLLGKVLKKGWLGDEKNVISVQDLSAGLYFIRIQSQNRQTTYKLIKK